MGVKVSFEKSDEEIIECCDVEVIRHTFKQLNCKIVYANELEYMMGLSSGLVRAILCDIMKENNCWNHNLY